MSAGELCCMKCIKRLCLKLIMSIVNETAVPCLETGVNEVCNRVRMRLNHTHKLSQYKEFSAENCHIL